MLADVTLWLQDHWPLVEASAAQVGGLPGNTIRLAHPTGPSPTPPTTAGLVLGESLAEGGMGSLRLGVQGALDRPVAVKAVRSDRSNPASIDRLLQEAHVMGRLEHPNIVPVYDLATGSAGEPLIVMRRIDGVPWSELIADPEGARIRFGAEDPLEWHLRVLMTVCNAVHFAHSRGLLHLDIKPANVMLGQFGEVYLLDWGIAVSLRPDEQRVLRAVDVKEILGTPSYMAPELLCGEGARLGPWTDVALLGATLFEVLTGFPPFVGPHLISVFYQVANFVPVLPAHIEEELADLCRSTLEKDPSQRPSTAEDLRRAIQRFLDHRGSARLAEEAGRKSEALDALRAEGGEHDPMAFALGSAARFGFTQALAAWPGNAEAVAGFRRVTLTLARRAMAQGDLRAAWDLASELQPGDPVLDRELDAARQAVEASRMRLARLESMGARLDKRTGQRTRWFILTLLTLWWTLVPALATVATDTPWPGNWIRWYVQPLLSLILAGGLFLWARDSMGRTDVNRHTSGAVLLILVAELLGTWFAERSGMAVRDFVPVVEVLWALGIAMFALAVDPRSWLAAGGYALAAVLGVLLPSWQPWALIGANMGLLATVVIAWWPETVFRRPPDRGLSERASPP